MAESAAALGPTWPAYVDDRKGLPLVFASTILSSLATLFVGTRLILRKVQRFGWGMDDYLIIAALVCLWALVGCSAFVWHYGLGRHVVDLPEAYWAQYLKVLYAFDLFYILVIGLVKLSILFFYERVFAIDRKTLFSLRCIQVGILIWLVTFQVAMIFQCSPVSYFWTKVEDPTAGYCTNFTALYSVHAGTNVLTDLIIYIFPMPIVWKLSISRSKKVGVLVVFCAGAIVVALSIVRATSIPEIVSDDFAYCDVKTGVWAFLEVAIGVITACLPTIKSLFVGAGGLFGTRKTRSNGYTMQHGSDARSVNKYNLSKTGTGGSSGGGGIGHHRSRENDSSDAFATNINAKSVEDGLVTGIPMDGIQVKHDVYWSVRD